MTTQTEYDAPAIWAPRLIAWAEQGRDHYEAAANVQRERGHHGNAADYMALAASWQVIADRARVRLVDISGLTEADVMDAPVPMPQAVGLADACKVEPPHQLVGFVGWLRALVGHLLPWVSAETWQTCSALMLMDRERAQGRLP